MWNIITNYLKTDIEPSDKNELDQKINIENLLKTKIVAFLGTIYFFPMIFLDYYRYTQGHFDTHPMTRMSMVYHLMMALFIIPAIIIKKNEGIIAKGKFEGARKVVWGTILNLGFTLIGMSIYAIILKDNVLTFGIYIIIVNLVFILHPKDRLWVNIVSTLIIVLLVYFIQKEDTENLILNLAEATALIALTFTVSSYQYNLKVEQFRNEKLLEKQRMVMEEALVTDFNKKVSEIEMRALRAQMNPHFLFNVLNSIKLYMVKNDSQNAAAYLTKFSRLIRLILNNSKSKMVLLSKELDALKLYIELEQLRFNNKFDFEMKINDDVDTDFFEIPPMILQPFIENAIWHGLMHKVDGKGMLSIKIDENNENIEIIITDNGIGRDKAQSIKTRSPTKHQSFGMKITSDRIDIVNHIYDTKASVEVIDLKDIYGKPKGTKVVINLPTYDYEED